MRFESSFQSQNMITGEDDINILQDCCSLSCLEEKREQKNTKQGKADREFILSLQIESSHRSRYFEAITAEDKHCLL